MSGVYVWSVILGLGAVTFLIRFSFLGLLGDRRLPPLAERALRYVPTAVLPALAAPMVVFDRETGGLAPAPLWIAAALALAVGALTSRTVPSILAGFVAWHLATAAGL